MKPPRYFYVAKKVISIKVERIDPTSPNGWGIVVETRNRKGESRFGCVLAEDEFGTIQHARFGSAAEAKDILNSL